MLFAVIVSCYVVALGLLVSDAAGYGRPISLSSLEWTLANSNGSVSIPAAVPGYALDTLASAGLVGDPLYRWVRYLWSGDCLPPLLCIICGCEHNQGCTLARSCCSTESSGIQC